MASSEGKLREFLFFWVFKIYYCAIVDLLVFCAVVGLRCAMSGYAVAGLHSASHQTVRLSVRRYCRQYVCHLAVQRALYRARVSTVEAMY